MKKVFIFILLVVSLNFNISSIFAQPRSPKKSKSQKINLIARKNGVGTDKDVAILEKELTRLGHQVQFVDFRDQSVCERADINVFLQNCNDFFFPLADKNYLIPNAEWYLAPLHWLPYFDKILCKTKETERIFKKHNPNTIFVSFTCEDHLDKAIIKDYISPMHLAGASVQKGTDTVIETWMQNPEFPSLFLLRHKGNCIYPEVANINIVCQYLLDSQVIQYQNACGLHICPSETEGFGHYIFESFSTGAVVVTTNAPPMNEFVTDKRCLVKYNRTSVQALATNYYVDEKQLVKVVNNLLNLSEEELEEIGQKNRQYYLENDKFFKEKLAEVFSEPISEAD